MKAIVTKWHPPTYTKPARISATDSDGNRVFISSGGSGRIDTDHREAAELLCHKMGWKGRETLIGGGIKGGFAWVFAESEVGK
jgi:hypothetical protein